jgi:ribose/xylose/arabinose/galactoside ABC-type transport system permease subunit
MSSEAGMGGAEAVTSAPLRSLPRFRGWMPLAFLGLLILGLGAYAAITHDAFLTEYNLRNLLLTTMPLAVVALGQTNALLVGGFDVSVAALMTLCVVTASFTMAEGKGWFMLFLGALALVGIGLATGLLNATLIRVLGLPSIIATLGTLSILQGVSLLLRDHPEGTISLDFAAAMNKSIGFMPIAFIGVVVLAVAWDLWLYRSRGGLSMRAVGLDETSARRLGTNTGRVVFLAFVVCSLMAVVAGFFSAALIQTGSPFIGGYALQSIVAAVLGGASLAGGRGSFVGSVLAALFLSLILNVLPLLQQPTEYGQIAIGALTLLALIAYQGPELWRRLRLFLADRRTARTAGVPTS